jgi:antitoxin component YwqK of YwqJK toxin-antitoxin module
VNTDGIMYFQTETKPFTGKVFNTNEDGSLDYTGYYKDGVKNGIWETYSKIYYGGDYLERILLETYINGERDGLYEDLIITTDTSEVIISKGEYRNGLKSGQWYDDMNIQFQIFNDYLASIRQSHYIMDVLWSHNEYYLKERVIEELEALIEEDDHCYTKIYSNILDNLDNYDVLKRTMGFPKKTYQKFGDTTDLNNLRVDSTVIRYFSIEGNEFSKWTYVYSPSDSAQKENIVLSSSFVLLLCDNSTVDIIQEQVTINKTYDEVMNNGKSIITNIYKNSNGKVLSKRSFVYDTFDNDVDSFGPDTLWNLDGKVKQVLPNGNPRNHMVNLNTDYQVTNTLELAPFQPNGYWYYILFQY